tara:strand:- start:81 stop:347 length:267 start_codon:yes stop_codon:yes gene_type:complete
MGGKVGKAECNKCYVKFPKNEMKQIEVKGNKSGSSFSFGKKGVDSIRVHSGRQYYRKVWVCNNCQGGGCAGIFGWLALFAFLASLFSK